MWCDLISFVSSHIETWSPGLPCVKVPCSLSPMMALPGSPPLPVLSSSYFSLNYALDNHTEAQDDSCEADSCYNYHC